MLQGRAALRAVSTVSKKKKKKKKFSQQGPPGHEEAHLYELCMSMQGNAAAGNLRACFGKARHTEWPMFAADVD